MRRHPIAFTLLAVLVVTAIRPLPPLVDAVTGSAPGDVELSRPVLYVMFAPLSTTLDALTLFSLPRAQWALAVWALALAASGAARRGTLRRRIGRALLGPLALVVLAGAALMLPRPVPRLVAADSAATVIDYHAHTAASHDGRPGWTPARAARWHARQGFEATYITDHNVVFGGSRINAIPLLPGVEWSVYRQHVIALGPVEPVVRDSFSGSVARMVRLFDAIGEQGGWSIASLPEYWRNHQGELGSFVVAGVEGFEIVNCAPKALAFPSADRTDVVGLAARHHLLVVGASDHHGWGQVTCVWNVSYPEAGFRGNRVFARPLALLQGDSGPWTAAVTQPWFLFRGLAWSERASWITWVLVILLYRAVPRRRGQPAGLGILARSIEIAPRS
ncbi:MAG: PHP domain-containing protein [Gemmatimonadales bacterium]